MKIKNLSKFVRIRANFKFLLKFELLNFTLLNLTCSSSQHTINNRLIRSDRRKMSNRALQHKTATGRDQHRKDYRAPAVLQYLESIISIIDTDKRCGRYITVRPSHQPPPLRGPFEQTPATRALRA